MDLCEKNPSWEQDHPFFKVVNFRALFLLSSVGCGTLVSGAYWSISHVLSEKYHSRILCNRMSHTHEDTRLHLDACTERTTQLAIDQGKIPGNPRKSRKSLSGEAMSDRGPWNSSTAFLYSLFSKRSVVHAQLPLLDSAT